MSGLRFKAVKNFDYDAPIPIRQDKDRVPKAAGHGRKTLKQISMRPSIYGGP